MPLYVTLVKEKIIPIPNCDNNYEWMNAFMLIPDSQHMTVPININPELQIKRDNRDNLEIIFLIFPYKHVL